MDSELLEQLLNQPESQFLDFKEAQYPFARAGDVEKSELLKDVLAFANSWRHTPAYLLIGVREVKGGRSQVVGIVDHIEDASIHQFVNSKTQRPVELSYEVFVIEGVEIGVIEIPVQERPVYARRTFGKVDAEAVYIRDGSSTRKASPTEIARMGAQQSAEATPRLALNWANVEERQPLASPYLANTSLLHPRLPADTFRFRERPRGFLNSLGPVVNSDYSKEVIEYTFQQELFVPLGFVLKNDSRSAARRVRFVGSFPVSGVPEIREYLDPLPEREHHLLFPDVKELRLPGSDEVEVSVNRLGDRWEVSVEFGDIRPQEYVYTDGPIWICSAVSAVVELTGQLFGDNLPEPIPCSLEVHFQVETRAMKSNDVLRQLQQ